MPGARPAAMEVDFDRNVTALYAAIGESDWTLAGAACRSNPEEAATWVVRRENGEDDGNSSATILWRFLPLHSACARDPPAGFLRALLRAYPEAASLKDDSGMLPLHYACGNRASRGVVEQLVECHPTGVREEDPGGNLPVHYCGQWGVGEEGVLELLLGVYPEGANVANGEGCTPLDLCKEGSYEGWEGVAEVLEREGKKAKRRDSVGGGRKLEVSVPEEREEDSLLSSTIEVRKKAKSPRSSSRGRRARSSSRSRRERSSSRTRRERSTSRSRRSKRADFDARDERASRSSSRSRAEQSGRGGRDEAPLSPRSHRRLMVTRSLGSMDRSSRSHGSRPRSLVLPLASPRYHERKTPRSSGKGPGFSFGQRTPRSAKSTRSVEFAFDGDHASGWKTPRSSARGTARSVEFAFEDAESSLPSGESGSLSKEGDAHMSESGLQQEVLELRARLSDFQLLRSENARLTEENERLRAQLSDASAVAELAEQREGARMQASAERRKMLLQLLAREDEEEGLLGVDGARRGLAPELGAFE